MPPCARRADGGNGLAGLRLVDVVQDAVGVAALFLARGDRADGRGAEREKNQFFHNDPQGYRMVTNG